MSFDSVIAICLSFVSFASIGGKSKSFFRIPDVWNLNGIKLTVDNQKVGVYQLNTEVGSAPQMICVDTNFEWPAERENIKAKYNEFETYVGNQSTVWY